MVHTHEEKHRLLRERLWAIMHDGKGFAGHSFNLLLILMIFVSLSLLPLEFIPQLREFHGALAAIEIFTTALFTFEYVLRIYAAPNRWKFIFSFYGLVDLVSIVPFYFGFVATDYVRVLRLTRAIRLLKLGEVHTTAAQEEEDSMQRGGGLMPGEKIEYIVSIHPVYLILGSLPSLLATSSGIGVLLFFPYHPITISVALCLFLFAAIFLWKTWLDFNYDVIFVTSQRLILQNQFLIGRSTNQVNYHAVTNVKPYYPSILSYFLGYGSIKVETTAAEPGHIELHTVRAHEKAAHIIMERCYAHGRHQYGQHPHAVHAAAPPLTAPQQASAGPAGT